MKIQGKRGARPMSGFFLPSDQAISGIGVGIALLPRNFDLSKLIFFH